MKKLNFKIRPHASQRILGGTVGLSDSEKIKLEDYTKREFETETPLTVKQREKMVELQQQEKLTATQQKMLDEFEVRQFSKCNPLTPPMREELEKIRKKEANPELPEGLKTYCKEWINEHVYGRRKPIDSKYIRKGLMTEEQGVTLIAVEIIKGMTSTDVERFENEYMSGICDIKDQGIIYDNKSSWDLSTFPMFEDELNDPTYEGQIQCYMEGYDCEKGAVVKTLIDCPEEEFIRQLPYRASDDEKQEVAVNLIFTQKYFEEMKLRYFPNAKDIDFIEIPRRKRVKAFYFERDREFIVKLKERVRLCRIYIDSLLAKE